MLIIGSGNVVHNLRGMDAGLRDDGFDWAQRFDEQVKATMAEQPTETAALDGHHDFHRAVPTPDHYLPLLYLAGLAEAANGVGCAGRRVRLRFVVDDRLHPRSGLPRCGRRH